MKKRMPRPMTRMAPTKTTAWGFWTTRVDSMAIMATAIDADGEPFPEADGEFFVDGAAGEVDADRADDAHGVEVGEVFDVGKDQEEDAGDAEGGDEGGPGDAEHIELGEEVGEFEIAGHDVADGDHAADDGVDGGEEEQPEDRAADGCRSRDGRIVPP